MLVKGQSDIAITCRDVCGCVFYHDKTKTPDRNNLKLGAVVVLDRLTKPIDFGFKRSTLARHGVGLSSLKKKPNYSRS